MKLSIILLLTSYYIISFEALYQVDEQPTEQWNQFNLTFRSSCYELSKSQWDMINWFYSRIGSYINVTEIVRDSESESNRLDSYISHFVEDLYHHTGLSYHNQRVEYGYDDERIDEMNPHPTNPFIWHTDEDKRENYTSHDIKENKRYLRSKLFKQNRQREDEPEFGSVVLASDIRIIDHFLNGPTRYPFDSRRSHYVIIIYEEFYGGTYRWENLVSRILSKLWKGHSILNVLFFSTCSRKYVSFVFLLPF